MDGLYLVTDEKVLEGYDLFEIVEKAAQGGVAMVQLREKKSSTREYIEHAIRLKEILKPYGIPLIINDRIDVMLASDADGIHIGQSDMSYETVRKILPKGKIIGLSVESREQVIEAENYDVSYIAASPIFSTPTKENTIIEWGLDGLKWIKAHSRHKIVAIGGINLKNIKEIYSSGADGVAVVSAIITASDVTIATKGLVDYGCLLKYSKPL